MAAIFVKVDCLKTKFKANQMLESCLAAFHTYTSLNLIGPYILLIFLQYLLQRQSLLILLVLYPA